MTERLYYRDAELLAFDAVAVTHVGDANHIVLDRTAFYPTSGGQPHDTGTLAGARVIDVVDGDDDQIIHVVDAPVPLGPVRGTVDAARRHDHMQQHSAQHLLSAIAADRLRWETASVHFGAEHSTIEFDTASVTDGQLAEFETLANSIVMDARAVTVSFEESSEAVGLGLRKAPARDGTIRVITIADVDRSACGGTHVASTAAIGAIVLRGVERVRGRTRVAFLAGGRVLSHLHARDALLTALAQKLSCAVEELADLAPKRQLELKDARDRAEQLERELAAFRVRDLADATTPGEDGVRRIAQHLSNESPGMLRAMAQAAGGMEHVLLVLTNPPAILVGAGPESGVHAGNALKALLTEAGGRGGGNANVAQGSVADPRVLERIAVQLTTLAL